MMTPSKKAEKRVSSLGFIFVEDEMSQGRALIKHKDLSESFAGNGRSQDDSNLAVARGVGNFPELTAEGNGAVASDGAGILKGEDNILGRFLWNWVENAAPFFNGVAPSFLRELFGFRMDVLLVVEGNLFPQKFVGLGQAGDFIALAKIGDSSLKVIESFFYFSLGLGISLLGKFHGDSDGVQSAGELGVTFRLRAEDGMIVHVIGERATISFQTLTNHAEVVPSAFLRDQQSADDFAGMIVLGEDEGIITTR